MERAAPNVRIGTPLLGFLILYVAMYSAFGVASPFLPSFIEARGIPPEQIGMLFAAGTAIRIVSAPLSGHLADRFRALRTTLAICAIATAMAVLGYFPRSGVWPKLPVSPFYSLSRDPAPNLP